MCSKPHAGGRRANSPVVAGAFFLAAVLIVFNFLFIVSDQFSSFVGDGIAKRSSVYDRRTERISIFKILVSNEKLNLSVTNRGALNVQLVSIWISEWNKTTANWHQNRPLNVHVAPGRTVTNIGQNLTDTLNPVLTYALRIVTARGNVFVGTYTPLGGVVSPGFVNTGFLTISFEPSSFLYTQGGGSTPAAAWDVPGTADDIVWQIQVTNHGVHDIKLYKWSAMAFIKITSASGPSSFNQEAFFLVGKNSTSALVRVYDFSTDPYVIPKHPQNDTQTGGNATWVWFAASTAGGSTTQHGVNWNAPSEYMIFMVFYFLYGTNEQYTQVIPFAGVHFT